MTKEADEFMAQARTVLNKTLQCARGYVAKIQAGGLKEIAPIHKAGWPIVGGLGAGTIIFLFFIWKPLGWLLLLATLGSAWFFRDPKRVTPSRAGLIIAPADGRVVAIGPASAPAELELGDKTFTRVSIFLSVCNVHVNRIPVAGRIAKLAYHKGEFVNASLDKASEANERHAAHLVTADGQDLAVVQIAGLIARRIVNELSEGQEVTTGQRFGIIRFGSRVDLYLPESWAPLVIVGQTIIGGETVIADSQSQEARREGNVS